MWNTESGAITEVNATRLVSRSDGGSGLVFVIRNAGPEPVEGRVKFCGMRATQAVRVRKLVACRWRSVPEELLGADREHQGAELLGGVTGQDSGRWVRRVGTQTLEVGRRVLHLEVELSAAGLVAFIDAGQERLRHRGGTERCGRS